MALQSIKVGSPANDADDALRVLQSAVAARPRQDGPRVAAGPDSREPSEGLALLSAYVAIDDQRTRQAVLDLLIALADPAATI